jgi:hypothetical protein
MFALMGLLVILLGTLVWFELDQRRAHRHQTRHP